MNNLMSINLITREAVQLFRSSNLFIQNLENQYTLANEIYVPSAPAIVGMKELIVLGSAALLVKNPEMTRRFWSGWSSK